MTKKQILIIVIGVVIIGAVFGIVAWQKIKLPPANYVDQSIISAEQKIIQENEKKYCQTDDDCQWQCSCGCIAKTTICENEGLICEVSIDSCKCVDNICKEGSDYWAVVWEKYHRKMPSKIWTEPAERDYYYYSDNRRIYLDKADNWVVVQIAKDQRTKLEQFLRDFPAIRLKQALNEERGLFWLEISADTGREQALQELQQNVSVVRLIPAFLRVDPMGEITRFIMTDEFRVEFHPNVTRNEVEKMNKKYEVEILSASKYNEYSLRANESSKYNALELANRYYESELTVWSLPNFLADIRLE